MPFHTSCTAMARIRKPKILLITPTAWGPKRRACGSPSHKNKATLRAPKGSSIGNKARNGAAGAGSERRKVPRPERTSLRFELEWIEDFGRMADAKLPK